MTTQQLRVLYVDDEPLVLRSIERGLRTRKIPWHFRFTESGEAALQDLAREPFDVVVADLRLPGLCGVELLTEVQRTYPKIARLVLSGQVGTDDCLRVMSVAHQCMAKPCNMSTLLGVVERVSWSRNLAADGDFSMRATQMSCLPSPPRVHFEVCAAIGRNAGLPEIAKIIDNDLALTAKLIQIVNSAFFTHGAQVSSVQRALGALGTDVVRDLLLDVEVFRGFEGTKLDAAKAETLSEHSKMVARLAHALAPPELASDAFVAGTLHDIGKLALATLDVDEATVDHASAGGFLLGLWGIADPIVGAITYHHEPGAASADRAQLVDIVHAAVVIADELEAGAGRRDVAEVIDAMWSIRNGPGALERAREVGGKLWEEVSCG
jgi:HD-like signal output (HDOD) protein/ActR/RegA family two-component response regulator